MANKKSSKKMIRVIARRSSVNSNLRNMMKTFTKSAVACFSSSDADLSREKFRLAVSKIHKCAARGVISKQAAARRIRVLNLMLKNALQPIL